MSGLNKFHNIISVLTESFRVNDEAIEELRIILEKQHNRTITTKEAEEVGRDLITVVETLANGRMIISKGLEKNER